MKRVYFVLLVLPVILFSCQTPIPERGPGKELIDTFWHNLQEGDTAAIRTSMTDGFQSVHDFGANNVDQELELISTLSIDTFSINGLIITQSNGIMVATYIVSVEETIEGQRLSKDPAPRMTVFTLINKEWKLAAHANLRAVPAAPSVKEIQEVLTADSTVAVSKEIQ